MQLNSAQIIARDNRDATNAATLCNALIAAGFKIERAICNYGETRIDGFNPNGNRFCVLHVISD